MAWVWGGGGDNRSDSGGKGSGLAWGGGGCWGGGGAAGGLRVLTKRGQDDGAGPRRGRAGHARRTGSGVQTSAQTMTYTSDSQRRLKPGEQLRVTGEPAAVPRGEGRLQTGSSEKERIDASHSGPHWAPRRPRRSPSGWSPREHQARAGKVTRSRGTGQGSTARGSGRLGSLGTDPGPVCRPPGH